MRDSSEGMIELLNVSKKDEGYFLTISVPKNLQRRHFSFGVTSNTYSALCRIFDSRPLDRLTGLRYRYFWNGSTSGKIEINIFLGIRCEVGQDGKSIDFDVPHALAANLRWFHELEKFDEAEHLETKVSRQA
ncbi:hypothetical protein C1752_01944 [Acaryochloris thomasi RCC1774]|uniref:Uncharacterized protein n=1 Tax=Acaryochloris thomasi RCC1774 TaxID=1764569 RepID=A0A2W1JV56_9CYAN|nr:hypothetical protein C1752_01944 [Acaryochloris thomasi RCC1774]